MVSCWWLKLTNTSSRFAPLCAHETLHELTRYDRHLHHTCTQNRLRALAVVEFSTTNTFGHSLGFSGERERARAPERKSKSAREREQAIEKKSDRKRFRCTRKAQTRSPLPSFSVWPPSSLAEHQTVVFLPMRRWCLRVFIFHFALRARTSCSLQNRRVKY